MKPRKRADQFLVEKGWFESREKAQDAILGNRVFIDGRPVDKPGRLVEESSKIEIKKTEEFVSRGGLKLKHALESFSIDVENKLAMDVGASTGGFTDCLLQMGASGVIAIDVGYGQLHWRLRTNPKVVIFERTNIRYFNPDDLAEKPSVIAVDVSFISIKKILTVLYDMLASGGDLVLLIKPQFEAGKEKVGKGGIIKDPQVHKEVIESVAAAAAKQGFAITGLDHSPIQGAKGNKEFLIHLKKMLGTEKSIDLESRIEELTMHDDNKDSHFALEDFKDEPMASSVLLKLSNHQVWEAC